MDERSASIALSAFTDFGPVRLNLLFDYYKSSKNLWNSSEKELLNLGLRENLVKKFIEHKNKFNFSAYAQDLEEHGIEARLITDKSYPVNLKKLQGAPRVLYVRGDFRQKDELSVAIVGTRQMTMYGKYAAEKFSSELAGYGITIISGLAFGIDIVSMNAAVCAGGRTVGVLASGLNIITPVSNSQFALKFLSGHGALVSEYPLNYIPKPYDFPLRDRIIAGLAKAVIVVEGKMKSGTFYTAKAAIEAGRNVYAVPGPITSVTSEAPNYLIQNGAKPLINVRDILEDLNIELSGNPNNPHLEGLSDPLDIKIVGILKHGPLHLDDVVRISGMPTSDISARLTIMEMKKIIVNLGDGIYKII
jgi:DNA processing protein